MPQGVQSLPAAVASLLDGAVYNGAISRERMRHVTLLEELEAYRPWNDQEERDRAELLRRLRSGEARLHPGQRCRAPDGLRWVVSRTGHRC